MVKDEDVCLHCGLCAERCPTSAWDMKKYLYTVTKAGDQSAPILEEQIKGFQKVTEGAA